MGARCAEERKTLDLQVSTTVQDIHVVPDIVTHYWLVPSHIIVIWIGFGKLNCHGILLPLG